MENFKHIATRRRIEQVFGNAIGNLIQGSTCKYSIDLQSPPEVDFGNRVRQDGIQTANIRGTSVVYPESSGIQSSAYLPVRLSTCPPIRPPILPLSVALLLSRVCDLPNETIEQLWDILKDVIWNCIRKAAHYLINLN